ncbi:peptidase U32 family protein [Enterococcus sp. 2201sp1_2201st1_B8_2201SCRN_220225]|uniref:peptidase U32 family protein n=2 Tax=unclassified Enterococcus TaxID=2608891 RepID=UPI0034A51CFD
MTRVYQDRTIELLAPVGTFEDFKQVIHSAADAVYLGGKQFNMRMHNPKRNLSNEEIAQAVTIAHDLDKKVYVTFNNMMTDEELASAESYLHFLEAAQVDALIIQDFGAVQLIKDLGIDLEMHLSIMANVHNREMLAAASELGVTRCVISREASLADVEDFVKDYPELEYEYFIHGDMCIAHGAQCYASGVYFGKSGNRGLCMKPCRWAYQNEKDDELVYPMAVKDMSLYQHIPELILSGVNSYKIEGRMRGADYLIDLINLYGEAIDRFLADPISYQTDAKKVEYLEENRVRDLSTAYAFGKPGRNNIALDGKREPRVFSRPLEEPVMKERRVAKVVEHFQELLGNEEKTKPLELRVTVDSKASAKAALLAGVDSLYLSGEVFAPNPAISLAELTEIAALAKQSQTPVYYVLPRMVNQNQFRLLDAFVAQLPKVGITGLVVSNLGEIRRYGKLNLKLRGDYGLNVYNHLSGKFYQEQGLESVTLSIEAPVSIVATTPKQMPITSELIVQGAPTLMYMEHSFKKAMSNQTDKDWIDGGSTNDNLDLIDENGFVRKIRVDQYGKNHLLPTKDFSYAVLLPELSRTGLDALRIEAKEYSPDVLEQVIALYREALNESDTSTSLEKRMEWADKLATITGHEQSLQTLIFN